MIFIFEIRGYDLFDKERERGYELVDGNSSFWEGTPPDMREARLLVWDRLGAGESALKRSWVNHTVHPLVAF